MPPNLFLADVAIRVKLLDNAVNFVAIQALSLRAGSTFEMMGNTASRDKASATERARNTSTTVGLGIQML